MVNVVKWNSTQMNIALEVLVRGLLILACLIFNSLEPFERRIHSDELWLYKNPMVDEYVTPLKLWLVGIFVPAFFFLFHYYLFRDDHELYNSLMSVSLAICLNAAFVDGIKIAVGRPRPDFLTRCFPDGALKWSDSDPDGSLTLGGLDITSGCTGDPAVISDGRKSFPSGHSSFAFCSLGVVSLWLCDKLRVWRSSKPQGWRLLVGLSPLVTASFIAFSRTCDYRHHWQDVAVGSAIGMGLAWMCYKMYFPGNSSCHDSACSSKHTTPSHVGGRTFLPS